MQRPDRPNFELVFRSVPEQYMLLDPEFYLAEVSDAYARATLIDRNAIGRHLFEVFPDNPDDPGADGVRNLRTSLERVRRTLSPDAMAIQKYDVRNPETDEFEARFWSCVNVPILGEDHVLRYILHRAEDVTHYMAQRAETAALLTQNEQISSEILLRAREVQDANRKLDDANTELDRLYRETQRLAETQQHFFARVSHELRTPLTLILGPAEKLLEDRTLTASQARDVDVVARNARTLLRHVNDLLDVVKFNTGAMGATYVRADLVAVVRAAVAHFASAGHDKGITLTLNAPDKLGAEVDVQKIERLLLNLIANAFKFAPDNGRILCRVASAGDCAVISVSDNGPGVRPEMREAIFEPFHQGDEDVSAHSSGTGLGLAIVKQFAELHGGSIEVREAPGGGALFECRLPLKAPATAQVRNDSRGGLARWNYQQATQSAPESAGPVQRVDEAAPLVLLVEDNADMRDLVRAVLGQHYRIITAQEGAEGLDLARAHRPDLIISDMMMPGLSGEGMLARLRDPNAADDTPVLFLTARADEETRVNMLRAGANDLIAKPFSRDELIARASNLIAMKLAADRLKRDRRALQEADLAKTRFLAVASHDMRQPLHALTLYLSALERRVDNPEAREILVKMERATESMTTMFATLLDLARIQGGAMHPEFKRFALQDVFDRIIAEHADGALDVEATAISLYSDPTLVERAIRNLVTNAMKHGGGKARLSARSIGDQAEIVVADDGPGISPDDQARIFEEFVRLKSDGAQGLGLGLAIVKGIASAIEMPVEVKSEAGRGARFILRPKLSPVSAAPDRADHDLISLNGIRTLVVDDDALAREAITSALADMGANAHAAANEGEARAHLASGFRPHLLVMDLRIDGELQGIDMAKRLRAHVTPAPRVIMVTGDTAADTLAMLRASDFAWLIKPVSAAELSRLVAAELAAA
jgi:signal transduction histidine kinase